jgi:hypothetical protein
MKLPFTRSVHVLFICSFMALALAGCPAPPDYGPSDGSILGKWSITSPSNDWSMEFYEDGTWAELDNGEPHPDFQGIWSVEAEDEIQAVFIVTELDGSPVDGQVDYFFYTQGDTLTGYYTWEICPLDSTTCSNTRVDYLEGILITD